MTFLKFYRFFIVVFVFSLILFPGTSSAQTNEIPAETELKPVPGKLPTLLESIRFEEDIFFCGVSIPLEQHKVRERLEKEMLLALWDRPQIILWIKRSSRYFPHIEKILAEHNLPLDLKYIPVIESALRAHSSSPKGAVGYWQFLRATGRQYGLKINSRIDERLNIFKSTTAASKYINNLKNKFDSCFLVMSAYNMGEYALKREITSQQNSDFFSLYLPLETQRYVFKIIAAKMIIEHHRMYGFDFKPSDLYPPLAFDRINFKLDFQIPIVLVAQAAGVPFKTIKDYNPELRGYFIDKGEVSILVPEGKAQGFKENFYAKYNSSQEEYKMRTHVVQRGDNLSDIAKKYKMSLSSLLKLNNLSKKKMIYPGDRLLIE